jgi:hypothetical protein
MPCRLHQSPWRVPDARRSNATLLPVRMPLAFDAGRYLADVSARRF